MKKNHLVILSLTLIISLNPINAQNDCVFEEEQPFNYSVYFENVLPLIGKAYNTINSMGFLADRILIYNYMGKESTCQSDYAYISQISFHEYSYNPALNYSENWRIDKINSEKGLKNLQNYYQMKGEEINSQNLVNGYLTMPDFRSYDTLENKRALNSFFNTYGVSGEELPEILYKHFNIFSFIKMHTDEIINEDTNKLTLLNTSYLLYTNDYHFASIDTTEKKSLRESVTLVVYYLDKNYYDAPYNLRIYDFNNDFLLPTDKPTCVLNKEEISLGNYIYTKIKMRTVAQPVIEVFTPLEYSREDEIITYEDIYILKIRDFVVQIDRGVGEFNNLSPEFEFDKLKVEKLFNEVIDFINTNHNKWQR